MSSTAQPPTDGECIAAVLAGSSERFSVLVARYEQPLLQAAHSRLGRRDLAEDAVQETFLCAYRWLAGYDSRYSFRTWLWTILLNQCRSRYRKLQRQPTTGALPAERLRHEASPERSPPERLLEKEQAQRLGRLLDKLPETQADALRLRFFGGLKFQEIADCEGCSLSGAKSRVRIGMEKLSALIRQQEATLPPAQAAAANLTSHDTTALETHLPLGWKEKP